MRQLPLDLTDETTQYDGTYYEKLIAVLQSDLDFHDYSSKYMTHDLHAFPAKFPPQLPQKFIRALTEAGDLVLDPMSGSGTTLLEAYLADRQIMACDIDPLALLLSEVKVNQLSAGELLSTGMEILEQATELKINLEDELSTRYDAKTREFIDYWFQADTQKELLALLKQIEVIEDVLVRGFFELIFSAIIITKSGGVSMAMDLAHTRPHKVKDKTPRSPFKEFEKRLKRNIRSLSDLPLHNIRPYLSRNDAQSLPIQSSCVDLIVTSPPYASNAIDYMRAHKFSLVWFGHPVDSLSKLRREYIGGESITHFQFEDLPKTTQSIVDQIGALDGKKGKTLARYYSEMTRVLKEMFRVLKPDKAAIVVVGSSVMRGIDTRTHTCLSEIGEAIGFEVPEIGVRHLDRNRRMMPARKGKKQSQIEERMHEEYVIGFYKPL